MSRGTLKEKEQEEETEGLRARIPPGACGHIRFQNKQSPRARKSNPSSAPTCLVALAKAPWPL